MKRILVFGVFLFSAMAVHAGPKLTTVVISTVSLSQGATYFYQPNTSLNFRVGTSTVAVFSSTGAAILGTTTNNDAATGFIGEIISSYTAVSTVIVASATYQDTVSIQVTAGDWDIQGAARFDSNGSTWREAQLVVSTTSGNSSAGARIAENIVNGSWASSSTTPLDFVWVTPIWRFSATGTTTVFLKVSSIYSAGQSRTREHFLRARRVR